MTFVGFARVPTELNFPAEEQAILEFWQRQQIFAKCVSAGDGRPTFVFYEGPPTANGMPHNGHVLTRAIKDLIPRYKTMRGYHVPRKAGWDTHGLPVEVEIEKELRIHGKQAIVDYGVEPFIRRCIESVFRYQTEWERLTDRIGFWVDLKDAYVTYQTRYVESVWWALSELYKRGLLYQGHKVVWWWAQGGTALSSAEVGQGYKSVEDPSAYVAFPLKNAEGTLQDASIVVWTTTPWTLPSNMYAAVGIGYRYAIALLNDRKLIVAEALLPALAKKLAIEPVVLGFVEGSALVGLAYQPPFDLFADTPHPAVHRVIAADFVALDSGTGIVHIAPAFGEDDHSVHRRMLADAPDLPLYCAVLPDGTFQPGFGEFSGRWVKDCDKPILQQLKAKGRVVHVENYRHDYPFCWRSDNDPLIQYARPAWYIRTTAFKQAAQANNQAVNWLPTHIKDGRFGDFLANNVDWALSRERFWGTPLNLWVNDVTGNTEAPGSVAEILNLNPHAFAHFDAARKADPTLPIDLAVHKPWIDGVTWQRDGEPGTYRRVPEVIDCWFDSGCVPFAQWGYPHRGGEAFRAAFPADFISEAIDQTRGWFYTLMMVSTLLFDAETRKEHGLPADLPAHPYRNCLVLGHVSDRDGKKESKSKGNYTPPEVILERVAMDFGVLPSNAAVQPKTGVVVIAKDDLEGLDLRDGGTVEVSQGGIVRTMTVRGDASMKRRVASLADEDCIALGADCMDHATIKPVDVPLLAPAKRITIADPHASAPGADAFRWFFYASNPPWNSTRHSLTAVRGTQKETLVKLRNVYSFFTIYANIDQFEVGLHAVPFAERPEIDRWVLGELAATTDRVTQALDAYDIYAAATALAGFVDGLSNWYVRRTRERFWATGVGAAMPMAKLAAYQTLYECLEILSRLFAPFTPFLAEGMYQNLVRPNSNANPLPESVHLAPWPTVESSRFDAQLSRNMDAVRNFVSLGLQVRTLAKQRVRQPLAKAHLIPTDPALVASLLSYQSLISEELNVDAVEFVGTADAGDYVRYKLKPNFRVLGARGLGKEAQTLKKSMAALADDAALALITQLTNRTPVTVDGVALVLEDVELAFETRAGFTALGDRVGVVVLQTELTQDLRERGLAREVQSALQAERKDLSLEFTARVDVELACSDTLRAIVERSAEDLLAAVLGNRLDFIESREATESGWKTFAIQDEVISFRLRPVAPG
jgi:isoleucyl-tRNA synthetase